MQKGTEETQSIVCAQYILYHHPIKSINRVPLKKRSFDIVIRESSASHPSSRRLEATAYTNLTNDHAILRNWYSSNMKLVSNEKRQIYERSCTHENIAHTNRNWSDKLFRLQSTAHCCQRETSKWQITLKPKVLEQLMNKYGHASPAQVRYKVTLAAYK